MVRWPALTWSGFYNKKLSDWVKRKNRGKTMTTSSLQENPSTPLLSQVFFVGLDQFEALLRSLILYRLSHLESYPVYRTNYLMARPLPFLTMHLWRRWSILKALCLLVSLSTNIERGCYGRRRRNVSSDGSGIDTSWAIEKTG